MSLQAELLCSGAASEIQTSLAQGMNQSLHWFPAEALVSRLAAVLVGMANGEGGSVLLGIAPRSAQVSGIPEPERALETVFQAALLADPPLVLPLPQQIQVEGQTVIRLRVPAGLPHVYNLDGRYLGREGAQTNPLPARRLRQLLMERGVVHFESQSPPSTNLEDLDLEQVSAYCERYRELVPGSANLTWQEILLRRGCLLRVDGVKGRPGSPGELLPTNAALLLFGKQPQQWLPGATILAARFSGTTLTDQFVKQEINGTLPQQLQQVQAFVQENIRRVIRLAGLKHEDRFEIPLEALRELLVNAVAHRDYNLQGDMIHVNIFSDRVEVTSPGGLSGPVTLANMLEVRFARNAVITQILADLGYVERLGYGLNRVVELARLQQLPAPQFEAPGGFFRATIYSGGEPWLTGAGLEAFQGLGLNPRQEAAVHHLLQNRRITNREFQEICAEVSAETLRRDLADLVRRNLLVRIGDKRATYYVLKHRT